MNLGPALRVPAPSLFDVASFKPSRAPRTQASLVITLSLPAISHWTVLIAIRPAGIEALTVFRVDAIACAVTFSVSQVSWKTYEYNMCLAIYSSMIS